MEDEHEVYGGDIPDEVEGEIEADSDGEPDDLVLKGDDTTTDEAASKVSAPLPFFLLIRCSAAFSECSLSLCGREF
jgi:hypothetical protein